MSARAYLYRRNGTYYFRWTIPVSCRLRMPADAPTDLRLSLGTSHPATARHWAARCWLAALDASQGLLASRRTIRYNELVDAIRGRARMSESTDGNRPALVSLGEVAGTVDLPALKDAFAALDRLGARFYIPIPHSSAALWVDRPQADGSLLPQLVERLEDFSDDTACLTHATRVAALAAKENLLVVQQVTSGLPGMWEGDRQQKRHYEVRLDVPHQVNLSSILVDADLAKGLPKAQATSRATATVDGSALCDPIRLSEGKTRWINANKAWTQATVANYSSYVQQFIDIVGDKLTTELKADDLTQYEELMKQLPKDWRSIQRRTGATLRKIAQDTTKKDTKTSPRTLKEKAGAIALYFAYLKKQGYWHGRYGEALFEGVKPAKGKTKRLVFTNEELQDLFSGSGIAIFEKAQFPLYVWGSVLLLYTGARPSEISQLTRDDVMQDKDGLWYLRIAESVTDEDDDDAEDAADSRKQLKTDASRRSIPLHPAVIDLGFLTFANTFSGSQPLFPEARRHKQKMSREIGDWFNNTLLPATPLKAKGAMLYCLRHTVIDRFKGDARVTFHACAYTGHRTVEDAQPANKVFSETYGRAHTPAALAASLHPLLDFGIDWTPMKQVISKQSAVWKGKGSKKT